MENKQLVAIVEESGLEKTQATAILNNFQGFFKEASEWEAKAKAIVITDAGQVDLMASAREARLALKSIRVSAENTRKSLKEKALREGRAIDGIANVIKALIVPLEEHLEKQEKYAENLEAERVARINAQREAELGKYVEDVTLYNYKEMSDEAFNKLVVTVKRAWDDEQAAIKKAEEERVENEKKEKAEQERIRIENEKLKKEAEEKEKAIAKEREEAEKKLAKEREENEKKLAKEREENEKKLAEEREKLKKEAEAREKLEKEKRDKEAADKKAEEERKEKERQAKLAPEKEKIFLYSEEIKSLRGPSEISVAGRAIVEEAEKKLLAVSQEIKIKLKNL